MLGEYIIELMRKGYHVVIGNSGASLYVLIAISKGMSSVSQKIYVEDIVNRNITYEDAVLSTMKAMMVKMEGER